MKKLMKRSGNSRSVSKSKLASKSPHLSNPKSRFSSANNIYSKRSTSRTPNASREPQISSRRNTARSPKSNKTTFKNSQLFESQKKDNGVIKIYKKGHKKKAESIHIDALQALNTCIDEEEKKNKNSFLDVEKLKSNNKMQSAIEIKQKEKMVIEIDEEKRLQELEKGRSSGELTPNNQIFSAGRH
jgi:hypothetical protein